MSRANKIDIAVDVFVIVCVTWVAIANQPWAVWYLLGMVVFGIILNRLLIRLKDRRIRMQENLIDALSKLLQTMALVSGNKESK